MQGIRQGYPLSTYSFMYGSELYWNNIINYNILLKSTNLILLSKLTIRNYYYFYTNHTL